MTTTAAFPVTPVAGANTQVVTGGTPVNAVTSVPNGGFITNPSTAADQGVSPAENLYVDVVNPATLHANVTCVALLPGQTFDLIPGQTTAVSVNAATGGHKFTCVVY